jgi:hypothetical protein
MNWHVEFCGRDGEWRVVWTGRARDATAAVTRAAAVMRDDGVRENRTSEEHLRHLVARYRAAPLSSSYERGEWQHRRQRWGDD